MLVLALLSNAFAQPADAFDWATLRDETVGVLSGYLQVDTTNPPGNETAGALYLQAVLAKEGIAAELVEPVVGRASLVARLEAALEKAPPLCLLSHIDVVTAEPERWSSGRGPLSGVVAEGRVWGRGSLDMKGMGALEVMTLVALRRAKVPLTRDVILLAVSDEEVHNTGIQAIVERWKDIGCSHVINEGGLGVKDLLFEDQVVFPISVGEKGALWIRMIAQGEPGHGSTPRPGGAPERLFHALEDLEKRKADVQIHDAMYELFRRVGASRGGMSGAVLRSRFLVNLLVKKKLLKSPLTRATITNTVNVTGYGGAEEPNVVPSEAWAHIDARLLPGTTVETLVDELDHLVKDSQVRFEVEFAKEGGVSGWDDPVFEALARRAVEGMENAVAAPVISPGFTDSLYLRPLGVQAYGLVPFVVTQEELTTIHGDNESVSVDNVGRGLEVLIKFVMDVAT